MSECLMEPQHHLLVSSGIVNRGLSEVMYLTIIYTLIYL